MARSASTPPLLCQRAHLTNEASVETWFIDPLLRHLGYSADDLCLKTSIREFKVGQGSKAALYKPDYVVRINGLPVMVIDAKSPTERLENWVTQCGSYCLELNKLFEHNPVEYYLLSSGLSTSLYRWDRAKPLVTLDFEDIYRGSLKFEILESFIAKSALVAVALTKQEELMDSPFPLEPVTLDQMTAIFSRLHQFIWQTEKKTPSAAFQELMKTIFVKIKKDRDLRSKFIPPAMPRVKDVVFSVAWIQSQTENENPINDPLFKNLVRDLEKEIRGKHKRRIFDENENINLHPSTIIKIVRELEHKDFYLMDEDIHGRMFESFLDATVRGPELGQFFTPRDIVDLMVRLADIKVAKGYTEKILDACCGSGGFLISAMGDMLGKAHQLVGLSRQARTDMEALITNKSLVGIDAGSDPPIHRIARMNMYLHGDGGSNIFFADSLDKRIGLVGRGDLELDEEIKALRDLLARTKFDVVLSNPPFSMKYSRDDREQKVILSQYHLGGHAGAANSLLSSVMFLERYKELVADQGRILAVIDDSILSGESYREVRNYIREAFVIIGIISLPGDAFRRSDARVKTSVLIVRPRIDNEDQTELFMEQSVYLGLTPKTAKRVGISKSELEREKPREMDRIVGNFEKFNNGGRGPFVVGAEHVTDRLDVKYCRHDTGRRSKVWLAAGVGVTRVGDVLEEAADRKSTVVESQEYKLLKVTYDGEVEEADRNFGDQISYPVLYGVRTWDILVSNMGVGRGAIGIVPKRLEGSYVSSEYTILRAKSKADALYYSGILRTKEILGDILASTTGMNRGRVRWNDMKQIKVPLRDPKDKGVDAAVKALENFWVTHDNFRKISTTELGRLAKKLRLDGDDSRLRWLASKPPE